MSIHSRRTLRRGACCVLSLLVAVALATPLAPAGIAAPSAGWQPDAPSYAVHKVADVPFIMSDGVQLVGDVYYPADLTTGERASGRFPVLLTMSPYGPGGQGGQHPVERPPAFVDKWSKYFVSRGYIYAEVDVRGTSRSGGDFTLLDPKQARDYVEVVDRVANRLDSSAGVVGLHGQSYLGLNQILMGRLLEPGTPVKAMAPSAVGTDAYREPFHPGGLVSVFGPAYDGVEVVSELFPAAYAPQLLTNRPIAWTTGRPATLEYNHQFAVNTHTGGDMAYEDDFWLDRRVVDSVPAIVAAGVPVLMTSGATDVFADTSLRLYAAFQNAVRGRSIWAPMDPKRKSSGRYQLVWGEFSDFSSDGTEFLPYQLQFYDTYLKGRDTGIEKTPDPLHIRSVGDGRWVSVPNGTFPMARDYTPLHLNADGRLGATPQVGSEPIDWSPTTALTFTSEPFGDGATVAGPITATVYATSTTPDVQLIATLSDVAPDGTATSVRGDVVPDGALIGSLRARDPDKTWTDTDGRVIAPYHPFTRASERPSPPGTIVRYDVELHSRMLSLEPGHRLRLTLTTQDASVSPTTRQLPNLVGGRYLIHHHSYLNLPLLPYRHFAPAADPHVSGLAGAR